MSRDYLAALSSRSISMAKWASISPVLRVSPQIGQHGVCPSSMHFFRCSVTTEYSLHIKKKSPEEELQCIQNTNFLSINTTENELKYTNKTNSWRTDRHADQQTLPI